MRKFAVVIVVAALVVATVYLRRVWRSKSIADPKHSDVASLNTESSSDESPSVRGEGRKTPETPALVTKAKAGVAGRRTAAEQDASVGKSTPAKGGALSDESRGKREAGKRKPLSKVPSAEVEKLLKNGNELLSAGKDLEAWTALSKAYWSGNAGQRTRAVVQLNALSKSVFWNRRNVKGAVVHTVQRGDSLVRIGKKYGVNAYGIARINGIVRAHLIKVNQKIKVFPGKAEILVSKSRFKLTLFIGGGFIKEYPIGQGKNNTSPVGEFKLDNLLKKPDWYPSEGGIIKYGDKRNPLGTRWLGFRDQPGVTGFGIHGTWEPDSIGKMSSNGCIRMANKDAEELYDFVLPGTRVVIEE